MMPGYDRLTLPLLTKLQGLLHSRFDPTVYQVSVLPILVATVLNARLERGVARVIPSSVQALVMPLICLCVCVPILILVIAPLFTVIGYGISGGILSFYEYSPGLMGLIAGGVWEFLVVVGLHWLISPFMLNNLSILGYDMMMAIVMVPTAATAGTMVGNYLYLRHHKLQGPELTNARNASLLAVIFGITEPVLYTYLVARTKLFLLVGAVKAGEPLLSFDRAAIEAAGYDPTVIVICTLPDGGRLTHCHIAAGTEVKVGQELVTLSTGVPAAA